MARKIRIKVNGQDRDAVEVDFKIRREDWNEYELLDGGKVKMRAAVMRMLQVVDDDGRPVLTPEGDRLIVVQSQNSVVISE